MIPALTDFQTLILQLAEAGLSNRQIAANTGKPFACIITTFSNLKRKGVKLPDHRPLDATAERAHRVRERHGIAECKVSPRFTAKGVKESTGEQFEVTSDSQDFSDAQLAALVGIGDASIVPVPSHMQTLEPRRFRPKGTYAPKTKIDHADVFRMTDDGLTPSAIGVRLGVRRGTITRILQRRHNDE